MKPRLVEAISADLVDHSLRDGTSHSTGGVDESKVDGVFRHARFTPRGGVQVDLS
jgi:hypothetical protein